MNNIDKHALIQFLLDSNLAGYTAGDEKKWIKEPDGSTTIPFEKGEWKAHDNFFGGEPYGGRIVVFHKDKPVWVMVYYGWIVPDKEPDPVYAILRSALKLMPKNAPFRGPKEYIDRNFVYTNTWNGDIENYSGEEHITENGILIYNANYMGGLVDTRQGV